MNINPILFEELRKNNNQITTAKVQELGFSRTLLLQYVSNGLLERISHGIYALPDSITDDMYLLQQRSDKIIFSHDSALFLNGMSERTPFIHSVTIPSNASLSADMKERCICYYVKLEMHKMGVVERKTTFGNTVYCYDVERTICDMVRKRNRCDEEMVITAIKEYADYKERNLQRLLAYAERLKVYSPVKKYMEVLL